MSVTKVVWRRVGMVGTICEPDQMMHGTKQNKSSGHVSICILILVNLKHWAGYPGWSSLI